MGFLLQALLFLSATGASALQLAPPGCRPTRAPLVRMMADESPDEPKSVQLQKIVQRLEDAGVEGGVLDEYKVQLAEARAEELRDLIQSESSEPAAAAVDPALQTIAQALWSTSERIVTLAAEMQRPGYDLLDDAAWDRLEALNGERKLSFAQLLGGDAALYESTLAELRSKFTIPDEDLPSAEDAAAAAAAATAAAPPPSPPVMAPPVAAPSPEVKAEEEPAPAPAAAGSGTMDASAIEQLIEQTRRSKALVVVYYYSASAFSMSSVFIDRCDATYASSSLYGGAPVAFVRVDRDLPSMDVLCAERGVSEFPTVQLWRLGQCEVIAAADLEKKLLANGVAVPGERFGSISGTATFEGDTGTGKPSATAVDEIDFTGGRALGSSKDGKRGLGYSGRDTRDFFPGRNIDDKPGDDMGKDGPPGSAPKNPRRDRPPGFG